MSESDDSGDMEVEWVDVDSEGPLSSQSDGEAGMSEDVETDGIKSFTPVRDDTFKLLKGHKESVFCIDFNSNGKYLASGGQDHIAIVWDVVSGEASFIIEEHQDSVNCVKFSPDGAYLCTGDMAGNIRVWLEPLSDDTNEWKLLHILNVADLLWIRWLCTPSIKSRSTKSRPTVLLAGDEDGLVTVWPIKADVTSDCTSVDQFKCISGIGEAAIDANFLSSTIGSDKPQLIVLYKNSDLRLWDLKSESLLSNLNLLTTSYSMVNNLDTSACYNIVSPKASQCANWNHGQRHLDQFFVTGDGIIYAVLVTRNATSELHLKLLDIIKVDENEFGSVESLDFSWTHPYFAFGTVTGIIGIYDVHTKYLRHKWIHKNEETNEAVGITSLRWSQFSSVFFTSTVHGSVIAWSGMGCMNEFGHSGCPAPLRIWLGHTAMILDLSLPPFRNQFVLNDAACKSDSKSSKTMEQFVCSASDDTTIRYFLIDFSA